MSKTEKPSPGPASPNKPDAARRALLRGVAVGIPSVVTLASGSAWGAANSVPCFQAFYNGKITGTGTGTDPYKWNGTYTIGTTTVTANEPVSKANTSQFCWDSGATAASYPNWGSLP